MAVVLKCAACGAEVEFPERSASEEATCPGCSVRVRRREGDEQMAMPVSMDLPEEFRPVDLREVSNKSDVLVGRYRKPEPAPDPQLSSEVVLAKALETLASSIHNLEERLDAQEDPGNDSKTKPSRSNGHGETVGVNGHREAPGSVPPVLNAEGEVSEKPPEEVVHLDPQKSHRLEASPVGARVLVRREAAKEAHAFRRQNHHQSDWDQRPDIPARKATGFAWLMERYPKSTVAVSLVLSLAFIVTTILVLEGFFERQPVLESEEEPIKMTALGDLWKNDEEAAQAETIARGFLNATSARAAMPFIYEAEQIEGKLAEYYEPISTPGDYILELKDAVLAPGGERRIFQYRVLEEGKPPRMLVVLPEGTMPKVFWEFFAEVGDQSWTAFLSNGQSEPVNMRVWAQQGNDYRHGYNPEDWQCYVLHDTAQDYKAFAYARRSTEEDWKLAKAFEENPVQFHNRPAVMAQLRIAYMAELPEDGERIHIVEIREVPATNWLPPRFAGAAQKRAD